MAILWRSWLAFITIIAVILSTFSVLFYLQFNSILSELIVHRLSVVAHTTANSFQSVTDLGLPFEMVNNAEAILKRSKETDTNIKSLHAFSPSGLIVYSTDPLHKYFVLEEVVQVQVNSDQQDWGTETEKASMMPSSNPAATAASASARAGPDCLSWGRRSCIYSSRPTSTSSRMW